MALATNSTPGSIVLAGDLTGTANTPQLRITGVVPGNYTNVDIVVDSKGRVVHATSGALEFSGAVIGPFNANQLSATGVVPGTYKAAAFTVDESGRITSAADHEVLSGSITGAFGSNVLAANGVVQGSYTLANVTVTANGLIATISSTPVPSVGGDVYGVLTSPSLNTTSVSAGSYVYSTLTVDAKGRVTAAANGSLSVPTATSSVKGILQVTANTGLTVNSGMLSGTVAGGNSTYGVVKAANVNTISITSGAIDVGPLVPKLNTNNIYQKATRVPKVTYTTTFTPDCAAYNVYDASGMTTTVAVAAPTNSVTGDMFDIVGLNSIGSFFATRSQPYNIGQAYASWRTGPNYCIIGATNSYTSTDGISWNTGTIPGHSVTDMAFNGSTYVTVGSGGYASVSATGLSWTEYAISGAPDLQGVTWNGSIFCAVGTGANAYTSPDGITWTPHAMPYNTFWKRVVWNGSLFCAIANFGYTATSPDGITWTPRDAIGSINYIGLIWTGTSFVAVPSESSGTPWTSPDGITWTQQAVIGGNDGFLSTEATFAANTIFIPSGTKLYISSDGVNWTTKTLPSAGGLIIGTSKDVIALGRATSIQSYSIPPLTFGANYKFSNTMPIGPYTLQCVMIGTNAYCTYK